MCSRITLCCVPLLAAPCGSVAKNPAGSETPAVVGRASRMDPQARTSKQNKNDGIDERALATIRRMTDLLSKSNRFAFEARTVWESTRQSGVGLKAEAVQQLWLDRPSQMFTTAVRDDGTSDKMWYREKTLTHLKVDTREYVQVSVPEVIDEMLVYTKERFELPGALNGFVLNEAESWFLSGTRTALYLGERLVQGIECEYVVLRKRDVDIQIWIRKGAQPLPVKYSITWNDAADRPKFTARFLEWELSPRFSERDFVFVPPEGAVELDLDGSSGRVKD